MLQIRHLAKSIEGRSVLAIDSLDIAPNEVVAVIGPMGCGKTTLIHLLAGLLPASGGTITFDGRPLTEMASTSMGVLFADDLLYEYLSVQNNLAFYCRWRGLPESLIGDLLMRSGLNDQAQKTVSKLTSSAQRRLAFARALLGQPRLLLLDQPPLRCDLETQELMARLIRQAAEAGTTVLLTDDDLAWASKCCTQVIELLDGRVTNSYAFERDGNTTSTVSERFTPFKVPARKEDRILLYDPGVLLYATSRDGKTYLRTAEEEVVTNFTLQELESRLTGRGFFKAHRAYLVNLQHIKAVIQYTRSSYLLQLDDKQQTTIPLSRQSEKALQDLLGY